MKPKQPPALLIKLSKENEEQQRKRTAEYCERLTWVIEELKRNQKADKKKAA